MAEYHDIFNDENCVSSEQNTTEYTSPHVSILEVASWFEGKEERKDLKQLQEALKNEIQEIRNEEIEIDKFYEKRRGLTTSERKYRAWAMKMLYVDFFIDQLQPTLDRVNKTLMFCNPVQAKNQRDAQVNIQRAKQVPIDGFIKFDRAGFAKCVFPGHNEKTGSMKYYKKDNRVHCFGCGMSGDAIDVYQVLRNCTFNDAVRDMTRT